jgi:hypothetical protein
VTQIGHEPPVRFDGGCLLISDLNLAAALLSLTEGGAAWDGARLLRYSDGGDEYERFLRLPETRLCHVELTGHHKGVDMVKVERADGWTDPATGRYYPQGTTAQLPRVFYHLRKAARKAPPIRLSRGLTAFLQRPIEHPVASVPCQSY